jgi:hypothetical protein
VLLLAGCLQLRHDERGQGRMARCAWEETISPSASAATMPGVVRRGHDVATAQAKTVHLPSSLVLFAAVTTILRMRTYTCRMLDVHGPSILKCHW